MSKSTNPTRKSISTEKSYRKIIRNRKRRIERRLDPEKAWNNQPEPIMTAGNIHYEMRLTPGYICSNAICLITKVTMS